MAMSDFTIVRRSLSARLFSTITTILTVAVAVGLMLMLLSMRESGRKAFDRGAGDMHLIASRDYSPLVAVLNGIFYANAPQTPIDWATYERIAARPWSYAVPVQQGDSYRGHPVMATTRDFFDKFKPDLENTWSLRDGEFFDGDFEIVLGSQVAQATGLRLDEKISLHHGASGSIEDDEDGQGDQERGHVHVEFHYTVVGILEPTGTPHDRALFTTLESSWIIHAHDRRERGGGHVDKTTIDDVIPTDKLITGVYLRAPGPTVIQAWAYQIRQDVPGLVVAMPSNEIDGLFKIVGNIDQILLAMAVVVLISSGIGILIALYNSMAQRRRQIAVLRVLGASQPRIFMLLMTESAVIGLMGAVTGIALCWAGRFFVAAEMNSRLGLVVDLTLPLDETLLVALAAIGLACIAGLVPAMMAYQTPVARNLRPLG